VPVRSQALPRSFRLHLHRRARAVDHTGRDHQIAALDLVITAHELPDRSDRSDLQHQSYSNSWAALRGLDFAYGTFRTDRRINGAVIMNDPLLNKAEHTPIAWRIAGMGE